jgi:hypothetical protein
MRSFAGRWVVCQRPRQPVIQPLNSLQEGCCNLSCKLTGSDSVVVLSRSVLLFLTSTFLTIVGRNASTAGFSTPGWRQQACAPYPSAASCWALSLPGYAVGKRGVGNQICCSAATFERLPSRTRQWFCCNSVPSYDAAMQAIGSD